MTQRMDNGIDCALSRTTPHGVLESLAIAGSQALMQLRLTLGVADLDRAAGLLADAEAIHVLGERRSFAVAAHLDYALSQLAVRSRLLTGIGGATLQQAGAIATGDALLAVSIEPCSRGTLAAAGRAAERGVAIVVLTDRPTCPLAALAQVTLGVDDTEVDAWPTLAAIMCLGQALVVRLGQRLDRRGSDTDSRADA
jgi:DNA-binding MurR/RpiR family transcriptional regulator